MLGYLRMASKVPNIISQVIQGKVVSVTICHECLDVSEQCFSLYAVLTINLRMKVTEHEESYFDISLPMPNETLPKVSNVT